MELLANLRHLWRHVYFRRLLAVRVATQTGDGVLQVALASYVLFSPQSQPDAVSVATVLAITLLPFSILGPFVGIVLDRWSRRQVMLVIDISRAVLAIGLGGLVATGLRTPSVETAFYGGVLITMSLNRFLLAALSASLPHTIEADEYLVANAVMPTVGPAGVLIGVGLGTTLRLVLGRHIPEAGAGAAVFVLAAVGFLVSAALVLRIPRNQLGPDDAVPARAREVVLGLVEAVQHLRERRPAGLGLLTIGAQRVVYGVVTVALILLFRNYFHEPDQVDAAIADLGLLVGVSGAGFVLAAVVTPPMTAWLGIRHWVVVCLVASAVLQVWPGAILESGWLLVASFWLGLTAQSIKICVDTLVQAHVDDGVKGRVFLLYDMVFNVALVTAAGIAALVLPPDGRSVATLVVLAGCYLLIGVVFAVATRGLSLDHGTESLHRVEAT